MVLKDLGLGKPQTAHYNPSGVLFFLSCCRHLIQWQSNNEMEVELKISPTSYVVAHNPRQLSDSLPEVSWSTGSPRQFFISTLHIYCQLQLGEKNSIVTPFGVGKVLKRVRERRERGAHPRHQVVSHGCHMV